MEESQAALAKLETANLTAELETQKAAVAGLESLLGELKNHQWAAKVGMLTIGVLLLWTWFVLRKLKSHPGAVSGRRRGGCCGVYLESAGALCRSARQLDRRQFACRL